jgi:hypothetical protein
MTLTVLRLVEPPPEAETDLVRFNYIRHSWEVCMTASFVKPHKRRRTVSNFGPVRPKREPASRLANWRVMGMWESGKWFLVVMGRSKAECQRLLAEALADYDAADLDRVIWLWYERFQAGTESSSPDWVPVATVPARRITKLKATRRANADAALCGEPLALVSVGGVAGRAGT